MVESGTKGFQKSKLFSKPNKNGTKIDHKWDQSGPGGVGKGATENQPNYEKGKERKRKET